MKPPTLAEIEEMQRRGFEAVTIAKAREHYERGQRALKLCTLIEAAFAEVRLGSGIGLHEARALDDYADGSTQAAARAEDEKEDWQKISAATLRERNSSLSFFDAAGMRFHLPAFLICDLQGEYGFDLDFKLTQLSDYSKNQFTLLDHKQRLAVCLYLLHIADDPGYAFVRPHILRALEEYWALSE